MSRRDPAWEHVTRPNANDLEHSKCNYCEMTFRCGVNRMKYHIAQLPGHDIVPCNKVPSVSIVEEMRAYLVKREERKQEKSNLVNLLVERQMERAGTGRVEEHRTEMPRVRKRTVEGFERFVYETQSRSSTDSHFPPSATVGGSVPGSSPPTETDPSCASSMASGSHSQRPPRGRLSSLVHLFPPRHGPGTQQTIETSLRAKEEANQRARKIVAQFWYSQGLPLHTFATPMFQRVFDAVAECGPGNFKAPTYTEMRTSMLQDVKHDIEGMMESHKKLWDKHGCSILCDGWVDKRDRSLINFMASSVSGTMFLKSINASGNVKNAEFIFEELKKVIMEVGEHKVVQVVTDNGSAYKAAGRLIMSHFPQIYWTPCAAHCIDLLLEDFAKIPWIKKVIRRAKYITKFVYAHPHLHHLFCQCSKGKEIIRPSTTRFATNYILLDSLQDAKDALMDTFVSNAWKNDDRFASLRRTPEAHNSLAIIFDCVEKPGKFWFEVLNVIEVTEPLLKVLRKVDGERPSIAFVYEAMFRAREAIRSYLRAHNLVDRFSIISTKFYERWNGQLHNDLHAAAHILNPRYGFGKSFDNNDDDVQLKIGLENVLDKLVSDPIERVQVAKDLDMYRKKMGLSFRRPVAENAKSCLNPEDWWTNYGVETKALKDVAIRIVSQPCSASGKKLFNNVW
eukprot:TRINITY_DN612_c0_g1_i10.p1 TRINITY_DN612_c0_g1~~TRINITY_DN612_c0_g1_i10.p1  ORF type:complete len:678 (-),score=124.38 TRINITY_DN612_c0_g1_i10:842-2875(-)